MNNLPWYKKLLAIICIAIVGIAMAALYIFTSINKFISGNSFWIVFFLFIYVVCYFGGIAYLKYSNSEYKEYYHTLWTGGWGVSLCMFIICFLIGIIF